MYGLAFEIDFSNTAISVSIAGNILGQLIQSHFANPFKFWKPQIHFHCIFISQCYRRHILRQYFKSRIFHWCVLPCLRKISRIKYGLHASNVSFIRNPPGMSFLMVHSPLVTLFYWCISSESPKASAIFMHCLFNSFLKQTSCYGCITFNMSPRFEVSKQKSLILPVHIYKPPLVYYLTRHLPSCFICHFTSAERAFPLFIIPKPYL